MRQLTLAMLLLLGSVWVAAQNYPNQSSPSDTGTATTVQGCLSSSNGNYMLTDKQGNTYQLKGDASKLSEHVGHEIRVTGTTGSASAATGSGASDTGATQSLKVSSLKHISKTCQNGGGMSH
jgi:Protein of unknown function (DUF5818)